MMVEPGAPVTAGACSSGTVRVDRQPQRARGPELPELERVRRSRTTTTSTMSNFGCGVNSNLAAMVANPEDLVHGREGTASPMPRTGTKAVNLYRTTPPTGTKGLQDVSTKKGGK